ncbi:hypothetical protein GOODEAATRI_013577 [Goodea atripinnis]|uniref:Ran-GTPase activating protein 1 C-terminal domain-containing protein n=1 Tax=Goodea atripinnis TaxID=208336 RepID=A0ABV0N1Y9_9TELE
MLAGARLTVLDLSDNAFGPDGVRGIEKLLKSTACFTLQELRLNNCGMGIGGGKILAASLIQCHKQSRENNTPLNLKVFVAGRNRLENDGATALAQAFQALKHLNNIQVINFGDCLVRPEGAKAIAETVSEGLPILKRCPVIYGLSFRFCVEPCYKKGAPLKCVFVLTDTLLRKAFSTPSFQGYSFVSILLVLLGLIKSEDKIKPVLVVPGHLYALEHVVRQDYFPKENVAVLEAFMSR